MVFDGVRNSGLISLLGTFTTAPLAPHSQASSNTTSYFLDALKQRCEYIKIDISELESLDSTRLVGQLWATRTERSNESISSYVFSESEKISWKDVFSAVNAGKSPRTM